MESGSSSSSSTIHSIGDEPKSCVQWMQECFQSKTELDALNIIISQATRLGTRLCRSIIALMFLMFDGKEMAAMFQHFRCSVSEVMTTMKCKNLAVHCRIARLLQMADQELDKIRQRDQTLEQDWQSSIVLYGTGYKEPTAQALDQLFSAVISKMDSILSYPSLPGSLPLMNTKWPIVAQQLEELETKLNGIETDISTWRGNLHDKVGFGAAPIMNAFLHRMEPKITLLWINLGLPEGQGKSCVQWMKECSQSKLESEGLNNITTVAVRLGTHLSGTLVYLRFLMLIGKEMMEIPFQDFRELISEEMTGVDDERYTVQQRLIDLLEIADQEFKNSKQRNAGLWATYVCGRDLFEALESIQLREALDHLFSAVISKMELILCYPCLPESLEFMNTKLPMLVEQFMELETKLNGIETAEIPKIKRSFKEYVGFAIPLLNEYLSTMEPKINELWNNWGLPEGEERENKRQRTN